MHSPAVLPATSGVLDGAVLAAAERAWCLPFHEAGVWLRRGQSDEMVPALLSPGRCPFQFVVEDPPSGVPILVVGVDYEVRDSRIEGAFGPVTTGYDDAAAARDADVVLPLLYQRAARVLPLGAVRIMTTGPWLAESRSISLKGSLVGYWGAPDERADAFVGEYRP